MKERPILFSSAMVRAILEGRKVQTRRVAKQFWHGSIRRMLDDGHTYCDEAGSGPVDQHSPYGIPGDRLWVRESFQPLLADGVKWADADYSTGEGYAINYVATSQVKEFYDCRNDEAFCDRVTPSIFMPRWASRITLEITDVRVQQLQEISCEDVLAEGAPYCNREYSDGAIGCVGNTTWFKNLWDSINAKKHPWSSNPWTWALTFRRLA